MFEPWWHWNDTCLWIHWELFGVQTTYYCYKYDPVDLTVVQNAKYQYNKKTKPASSSNMADEIQNAISPL